jgi:hypothetical protein
MTDFNNVITKDILILILNKCIKSYNFQCALVCKKWYQAFKQCKELHIRFFIFFIMTMIKPFINHIFTNNDILYFVNKPTLYFYDKPCLCNNKDNICYCESALFFPYDYDERKDNKYDTRIVRDLFPIVKKIRKRCTFNSFTITNPFYYNKWDNAFVCSFFIHHKYGITYHQYLPYESSPKEDILEILTFTFENIINIFITDNYFTISLLDFYRIRKYNSFVHENKSKLISYLKQLFCL